MLQLAKRFKTTIAHFSALLIFGVVSGATADGLSENPKSSQGFRRNGGQSWNPETKKMSSEQLSLLIELPLRTTGEFVGRIKIEKVVTLSGCTVPPTENMWIVLACSDHFLPIAKLTSQEVESFQRKNFSQANEHQNFPILSERDLSTKGIKVGSQVIIKGTIVPIRWSGTVGLQPIYGILPERIQLSVRTLPPSILTVQPVPTEELPLSGASRNASAPTTSGLYDKIRGLYVRLGMSEKEASAMIDQMVESFKEIPEDQLRPPLIETARQLQMKVGEASDLANLKIAINLAEARELAGNAVSLLPPEHHFVIPMTASKAWIDKR
jgi:hypothetical protein